jgi:CubicO group peptidase (beta-lactamase class C family)
MPKQLLGESVHQLSNTFRYTLACALGALSLSNALADSPVMPGRETVVQSTWEWRTSTPEAQGMDSAQLAKLFDYIEQLDFGLDAVMIVRHGHIVAEAYYAPYRADLRHQLFSATKSVLSTVAGIAVGDGKFKLDDKVVGFFPKEIIDNNDAKKQAMAVRHLLQMTTGFNWEEYEYNGNVANVNMFKTSFPAQYALNRPMLHEPGTHFNYNEGAVQLLSAIITKAAGKNAYLLARTRLFEPLGIDDVSWSNDTQGTTDGGGGLELRTRDLAKIGLLYLRNGVWEEQQVLPVAWVREATRPLPVSTRVGEEYGYLWWVDSKRSRYRASGRRGQFLVVMPKQDIVVAINGHMADGERFEIDTLLDNFIVPSVKSAGPLPANAEAHARLMARIGEVTADKPLPDLAPEIADAVDGDWYRFNHKTSDDDEGKSGLRGVRFSFSGKKPIYYMQWYVEDGYLVDYRYPIAREYREIEGPGSLVMSRGGWMNDYTFLVESRYVSSGYVCQERFRFEDDIVDRTIKCGDGRTRRARGKK